MNRTSRGRNTSSNRGDRDHNKGGEKRSFNKSSRPVGKKSFEKKEESQEERPAKGGKRIGKSRPSRFDSSNGNRSKAAYRGADRKDGFTGKRKDITRKKADDHKAVKTPKKSTHKDGKIRLNRFLANSGVCSRREADTYIESGVVQVNGKVVTELGMRVLPTDDVRFDGTRLTIEQKRYVLLNKPKGFVTTTDDPNAEKTVMDLVKHACEERIYPVGRLDKDTTGLLLLTNDGDLTKKLTHPKYDKKKIYHAHLHKDITRDDLNKILEGFDLEDGFICADSISYVDEEDKTQVGIEIHSGRNRIVRRTFAHLGYKVLRLDRVYFAGLTKKNLPRSKWRMLTQKEINILNM